jgi:hypothetical protein
MAKEHLLFASRIIQVGQFGAAHILMLQVGNISLH